MKPTLFQAVAARALHKYLGLIRVGHLVLQLPDGSERHYGDSSAPVYLRIRRHAFFTRVAAGADIGLGEAYTDGDWDTDDLPGLIALFINNMLALEQDGLRAGMAKRGMTLLRHALNRNTRAGSRRNIRAHYDLGNDFYRTFLDPDTMAYSCAMFDSADEPLAEAQLRKFRRLAELADIRPEHHVLEIGCGWGGFAIDTAKRIGCRITGVTISREQYALARERVVSEGLDKQVEIVLRDYRDVGGSFDRIVSIEMLEAVGHAYYGAFFSKLDRLLRPGGRVALQVITIPDQRYDAYRRNPDWIQTHIFPGGTLPSLTALSTAMARHAAFTIDRIDNIGVHYAETLRRWRRAFNERAEALLQQGRDGFFQRKWNYYFAYCEAGFQTRYINDLQLVLTRPADRPY